MPVLAILFALFLGQQPGPSSLQGFVVKAGTSEPVAKAVVELLGRNGEAPVTMTTGSDGRFEFTGVRPGRYRLAVSRSGYLSGSAGSERELTVQGGTFRNLRLSLTATGAVAGRVFDDSGEPLANVSVQALRYSWEDGQRTLKEVKSAETNDRGEFRIFWLPPGRYFLRANPNGDGIEMGMTVRHSPDGKVLFIHGDGGDGGGAFASKLSEAGRSGGQYAPVYYPGTADPQAAALVDVAAGADVGGVDFVLVRVTGRRVRAIAIDGATGLPVPNPSLMLVPRSGSSVGNVMVGRALDGDVFEARNVLPGAYFLVATARINAGSNSFWVKGGRTAVDVADKDVDGVTVVVQPTVDIPGRVTFEAGPAAAEDSHPVVTLRSRVDGVPGRSDLYAEFSSSRQFSIAGVHEGDYRAQLTDLPKGTYLKSIRFGGAEVLNGTFTVDPRARGDLEIVLGANAGTLAGVVTSALGNAADREPLTNASVALVPTGPGRDRPDLSKGSRSDESGRFQIEGIAPGEYLLFAWEDIDEGLWRDPEFIRRNERLGRAVRIAENGREAVELTALPIQ